MNFNGVPTSSSSIHLVWSPPAPHLQNGIIRSYIVSVVDVHRGLVYRNTVMDNALVVHDLRPYYHYFCAVAAVTVATGPHAITTVPTLEDGEQFTMHVV